MAYVPLGGLTKKELKQLRELAGLTQKDLASKLQIAKSTIESWEYGSRPIPLIKVSKILDALGVNMGEYAERKEKERLEAREGRQKVCFEFEVPGGWAEDFCLAYEMLSGYVKKYLIKNGVKEKDITKAMIYAVVDDGRSITGPDSITGFANAVAYHTMRMASVEQTEKVLKLGDECRAKFKDIQLPRFSEFDDNE